MSQKAWVFVGWIAFVLSQIIEQPVAKLFLLATSRGLP
jgi:hypothetical protein